MTETLRSERQTKAVYSVVRQIS